MATETQVLNSVEASSNLTGATVGNLDTDDGSWTSVDNDGTDTTLRCAFPTPTGKPTTGAGLQTFRAVVRKEVDTGGTDPTLGAELYESGSLVTTLASGRSITTSEQTEDFTWDAADLGLDTGANVEVRFVGSRSGGAPGNRRSVSFDYVAWLVDYTAGGTTRSIAATGATVLAVDTADLTTQPSPIAATGALRMVPTLGKPDLHARPQLGATGALVLAKGTAEIHARPQLGATGALALAKSVADLTTLPSPISATGSLVLAKSVAELSVKVAMAATGALRMVPTLGKPDLHARPQLSSTGALVLAKSVADIYARPQIVATGALVLAKSVADLTTLPSPISATGALALAKSVADLTKVGGDEKQIAATIDAVLSKSVAEIHARPQLGATAPLALAGSVATLHARAQLGATASMVLASSVANLTSSVKQIAATGPTVLSKGLAVLHARAQLSGTGPLVLAKSVADLTAGGAFISATGQLVLASSVARLFTLTALFDYTITEVVDGVEHVRLDSSVTAPYGTSVETVHATVSGAPLTELREQFPGRALGDFFVYVTERTVGLQVPA